MKKTRVLYDWREFLEKLNTPGEFVKLAIVPRLEAWIARSHGGMNFHLSQVLTGHGCFGKYLCRIGKKPDTSCDFCGETTDNVYHVLRDCPVWDPERIALREVLKLARDYTLGDVIEAICLSKTNWNAFSAFAEKAMREKEDEERRRERAGVARLHSDEEGSDW